MISSALYRFFGMAQISSRGFLPLSIWARYFGLGHVIHLAIAVPLLVLEVPFMKWAHLMYRPLALYLKGVSETAVRARA